MFALPDLMSHVSSAAFAQAQAKLIFGSGLLKVCSPLLRGLAQPRIDFLEIVNF
jgi:hypothetical protein